MGPREQLLVQRLDWNRSNGECAQDGRLWWRGRKQNQAERGIRLYLGSTKASADPWGSSEAGMTHYTCLKFGQVAKPLHLCID